MIEDKFNPVRSERKKEHGVLEITRATATSVLTGIDRVYYENAYPVTAILYGLYRLRDPDPDNLASLRDGDLNCVAQRVFRQFKVALRSQKLTPKRRSREDS